MRFLKVIRRLPTYRETLRDFSLLETGSSDIPVARYERSKSLVI
jgi:hypothetical protein